MYCKLTLIIIIIILLIINVSNYETFNSNKMVKDYLQRYLNKVKAKVDTKEQSYNCSMFDSKTHDSLMESLNDSMVYNIKF